MRAQSVITSLTVLFFSQALYLRAQESKREAQGSFDLSRLVNLGLGPAGPAVNYLLPNTVQGFTSDLSNGYNQLSSFPQAGLNNLQSGYQTLSDNVSNRYNKLQQQVNSGFNALNTNQILLELYQLLQNPQEVCRNLALQAETGIQSAQALPQQASQAIKTANQSSEGALNRVSSAIMNSQQQASQVPGSLMNKLSNGFFGK